MHTSSNCGNYLGSYTNYINNWTCVHHCYLPRATKLAKIDNTNIKLIPRVTGSMPPVQYLCHVISHLNVSLATKMIISTNVLCAMRPGEIYIQCLNTCLLLTMHFIECYFFFILHIPVYTRKLYTDKFNVLSIFRV